MKKVKILSLGLLSFIAMQTSLVACNSPKQRPEVVDKEIKPSLLTMKDAHDLTSDTTKAFFYKTSPNQEIDQAESATKTPQIIIDENTQKILDKVKNDVTKKTLADHLEKGLIGFVVLEDKITIYKVLTKDQANDVSVELKKSLTDLSQAKKALLDAKNMNSGAITATASKSDLQFVEITSIKITTGVMENKKTKYYDEKMSLLTVAERPLDLSTHILLGDEVAATDPK